MLQLRQTEGYGLRAPPQWNNPTDEDVVPK
jgi:hypothetical protein